MIKVLLLASAVSLGLYATAQAAVPALDGYLVLSKLQDTGMLQQAKSNNSGSGNSGGDNSGSGNSGSGHSGGDDNDSDDNDSDDNDSDDDNGSNDDNDNDVSGSGRDKPRVPGGSGCDDAGDIAEHAECTK